MKFAEKQQNAPFHIKSLVKKFYGRAKKAGASHHAPLNTPLNLLHALNDLKLSVLI